MAKYCNVCQQTYSVEFGSCPFCEVPALLERSRPRKPVSTSEATPLTALPISRPSHREMNLAAPVGAGHNKSSDQCENGTSPLIGPRSKAKMLLGRHGPQANAAGSDSHKVEAPKDQSGAEIDLGSPIPANRGGDAGPPSGASFVSWTSLIDDRKDFEDDRPAKSTAPPDPGPSARALLGAQAATDSAKSATKLSTTGAPPRTSIWFYLAAVAIGVLLAIFVKLIR